MTKQLLTQRSDNKMSDHTRCTLAYIAQHPDCTFAQLEAKFLPADVGQIGREQYRARLAYLVRAGHLECNGFGKSRTWCIGHTPHAFKPKTVRVKVAPRAQACAMASETFTTSVKVPPSQYDRMHCGPYVPEAGPVLRTGALDFKRIKTVGDPC